LACGLNPDRGQMRVVDHVTLQPLDLFLQFGDGDDKLVLLQRPQVFNGRAQQLVIDRRLCIRES
jgi:hypothetical protein